MNAPKVRKVCEACGSERVFIDATAEWNVELQAFVLCGVHDHTTCDDCNDDCNVIDKPIKQRRATQRDAAPSAQDASG
jgi:hypothetical protein